MQPHLSLRRLPGVLMLAIACIVSIAAGVLVAPQARSAPVVTNESGFDPGFIISDDVFFDSNTMDAAAVQRFLEEKRDRCDSGFTCLKDYVDTSRAIGSDAMCGSYDGGYPESAATIIAKVARACGINPRVILVTLQKEQGLVTMSNPSPTRFRVAMGYACPDTADCDSRYYGFFNQVWAAAWQFKRYANPPGTQQYFTWFMPGRESRIDFNPAKSCGSTNVYIQNQATANLYYYTPYQPNAASIKAGYGTGDECSSYGNRNFFNYFTAWFGGTRFVVRGAIAEEYARWGGHAGRLGSILENERRLSDGGFAQDFVGGTIVWSSATGAHAVVGGLRDGWGSYGWSQGVLAYPKENERALGDGGFAQDFEGGTLIWSPSAGSFAVRGLIREEWGRVGWSTGALGYPRENERALSDGGFAQDFAGGTVIWQAGASRAYAVSGQIRAAWGSAGWERGNLGYPIGQLNTTRPQEEAQAFQGAMMVATSRGVFTLSGAIRERWSTDGGASAGSPLAPAEDAPAGGYQQKFSNGLLIGPSGGAAYLVRGGIGGRWQAEGGASGRLGFPLSDERASGDGYVQRFTGGYITWQKDTGTQLVVNADIAGAWSQRGLGAGWLGLPQESTRSVADHAVQTFAAADMVATPTRGTVWFVQGGIRDAWRRSGEVNGALGLPVESQREPTTGVWAQDFVNGTIVWQKSTGGWGVTGPIREAWGRSGWLKGALGAPLESQRPLVGGGVGQDFSGGTVVLSNVSPTAYFVKGAIREEWGRRGWTTGAWGFPLGDEREVGDGVWEQAFERATVRWSAASGIATQ